MIHRRRFVAGVLGVLSTSTLASAQSRQRIPRVGVLWHAANEQEERVPLGAFRQGLRELGYVEGQTIALENRYPNEQPERFVSLASELVDLRPDVIVAVTRAAALAVQRATNTIPVVFIVVPDPVGDRLVDSLARPGGHITGITNMALELMPKRIELLKEALPRISRMALLVNASHPEAVRRYVAMSEPAAARLGITLQSIEVRNADDFERAFTRMKDTGIQGMALTVDGLFYAEQQRLIRLALDRRLPMIMYSREMAEGGAFMAYGPNIPSIFRRGAVFVDKILKGTKPAEIPVEQPPVIELLVNETTARTIGVSVAPSVLTRANDVLK